MVTVILDFLPEGSLFVYALLFDVMTIQGEWKHLVYFLVFTRKTTFYDVLFAFLYIIPLLFFQDRSLL